MPQAESRTKSRGRSYNPEVKKLSQPIRIAAFGCLDDRELTELERHRRVATFSEGDVVVREGDLTDDLYVILEGCASVSVDGALRRALRPGDLFGELAVATGAPRSATVVAATDLRCAVWTAAFLRPFLIAHPRAAVAVAARVAGYLRPSRGRG
jgi:CRP-like cAMP-binding protein